MTKGERRLNALAEVLRVLGAQPELNDGVLTWGKQPEWDRDNWDSGGPTRMDIEKYAVVYCLEHDRHQGLIGEMVVHFADDTEALAERIEGRLDHAPEVVLTWAYDLDTGERVRWKEARTLEVLGERFQFGSEL